MPLCNGANLRPVEWHTEGKLSNTRSYHPWMIEKREWFDTTADKHNCAELAPEANQPSAGTFYSFFFFFFVQPFVSSTRSVSACAQNTTLL